MKHLSLSICSISSGHKRSPRTKGESLLLDSFSKTTVCCTCREKLSSSEPRQQFHNGPSFPSKSAWTLIDPFQPQRCGKHESDPFNESKPFSCNELCTDTEAIDPVSEPRRPVRTPLSFSTAKPNQTKTNMTDLRVTREAKSEHQKVHLLTRRKYPCPRVHLFRGRLAPSE